ncbi:18314_t:CDS:1, partial [Dentiscutata erythropus]
MFSFTDQSNPVLNRVKKERKNKAIWNNDLYGACFGSSDLCMNLNYWTSNWNEYEHRITSSRYLNAEEYEVLAIYSCDSINSLMNIFLKIL